VIETSFGNDNNKAATAAGTYAASTTTSRSSLKTTTASTTGTKAKATRRSLTVTVHMPVPLVRVDTTSSTFSSGTFRSLDGLSNSYKMVRTELRQRLEPRYEALLISQRTTQPPVHHPDDDVDGSQRRQRRRQQHVEDELSLLKRRLVDKRSSLSSQQSNCSSSTDHRSYNNGTTKSSRRTVTTTTPKKKSVHFCAPLVTEIHHRPYTPTSDIAKLFFQEDELEMFADDRSQDPGDVVECEYMEEAYAVSVAYQRRQSIDE
jgi:hypothetical protein